MLDNLLVHLKSANEIANGIGPEETAQIWICTDCSGPGVIKLFSYSKISRNLAFQAQINLE